MTNQEVKSQIVSAAILLSKEYGFYDAIRFYALELGDSVSIAMKDEGYPMDQVVVQTMKVITPSSDVKAIAYQVVGRIFEDRCKAVVPR